MSRKGSTSLTLLSILFSVVVIGGIFYFVYSRPPVVGGPTTAPTSTTPITTPTPAPITHPVDSSTPTSTIPGKPYLTPSSGPVGTLVTIHGSGFAATGNTIEMRDLVGTGFKGVDSSDGATLSFVVPGDLGPNCNPDQACPDFLMLVTAGSYPISVITNSTTETIGTFTVTGGTELQ